MKKYCTSTYHVNWANFKTLVRLLEHCIILEHVHASMLLYSYVHKFFLASMSTIFKLAKRTMIDIWKRPVWESCESETKTTNQIPNWSTGVCDIE